MKLTKVRKSKRQAGKIISFSGDNMKTKFAFILILISYSMIFFSCQNDNPTAPAIERWSAMDSGMNQPPIILSVYNNELIAGIADTNINAKCILKWNGTFWSTFSFIGPGGIYGANVSVFTVYNGELIAGGFFTEAGWNNARNIAKWDGGSWSSLGSGMNDGVGALTIYNGELIAGGRFTTAGGDSANCIARWNGSTWSQLGIGMGGGNPNNGTWVSALTVYNGELIAGGNFTTAGGVNANYIARWNGSTWSPLGGGMNGGTPWGPYVSELIVYNGALIAGGDFITAGGLNVNNIARWNGSSWSSLGSGMGGYMPFVYTLTVYNGVLMAGGDFTTAGGVSANCIAQWNGSNWSTLGSELGNGGHPATVTTLTVFNDDLIVGGNFSTAGGVSTYYIAKWH